MDRRLVIALVLYGLGFAAAEAQPWRLDPTRRAPLFLQAFCGREGTTCCPPYQGSGGVIGPNHCNEGLGCNVATDTCERPCGHAGQVCCDGPETEAAQGGPMYVTPGGAIVPRKPMCEASACDTATRRCVANCGQSAGDSCCPPQPQMALATCLGPGLSCHFADVRQESGVCEPCGGLGQISCTSRVRCGPGLEEALDGRCVCSPTELASSAVSNATACPFWLKRRTTCFERTTGGLLHAIVGSEIRPPLERDHVCIEGAFRFADGTVWTDLDNPRIWDGAEVQNATRTGLGVSYGGIDHVTVLSQGDGPSSRGGFYAYDTAGSRSSLDAQLPRIPSSLGSFGSSGPQRIDLLTPGARVGHRPLQVEIKDIGRNQIPLPPSASFRLALNPDVLLVPVQVFSIAAASSPDAEGLSRENALAVFDRGADLEDGRSRLTEGGQVTNVQVSLPYVVLGGDAQPAALKHTLPDDVWATCGIQFRLVQYARIVVPDAEAFPRSGTHAFLQGAVRDLLTRVRESPSHVEGPLTILVAPWCSDVNQAAQGSFFSPVGQALISENALCIRYSANLTVLAHEIGHVILGNAIHFPCNTPGVDNLMCPENGGPILTLDQCRSARENLLRTPSRLGFPAPR